LPCRRGKKKGELMNSMKKMLQNHKEYTNVMKKVVQIPKSKASTFSMTNYARTRNGKTRADSGDHGGHIITKVRNYVITNFHNYA
jgi:hypothetical protein